MSEEQKPESGDGQKLLSADDYDRGFIDALTCFAHWYDGKQYVGTIGQTLTDAIANRKKLWYYRP